MDIELKVSADWLREHALESTKQGWDGPRWRLPKEVEEMQRRARLKAVWGAYGGVEAFAPEPRRRAA